MVKKFPKFSQTSFSGIVYYTTKVVLAFCLFHYQRLGLPNKPGNLPANQLRSTLKFHAGEDSCLNGLKPRLSALTDSRFLN